MQSTEEFYTTEENQIGGGPAFITALRKDNYWDVENKLKNGNTLFSKTADPNQIVEDDDHANRDLVGKSALIIAVELNKPKMVELLLKYKADPDFYPIKTYNKTPLIIAIELEYLEIVELLLSYRAKANFHPETYKQSPLYLALGKEQNKMARLLLEHHASKNIALNYAVLYNDLEKAELLLKDKEYFIDPNIFMIVDEKKTPLIFALEHDQIDMANLLLKYNADPNILPFPIVEGHSLKLVLKMIQKQNTELIPENLEELFININKKINYTLSLILSNREIEIIYNLINETNYENQIKVYNGRNRPRLLFDVDRLIKFLSFTSRDINNGKIQKKYLYNYLIESIKSQLNKM